MFVIRERHLAAFRAAAREAFEEWVVGHVAEVFPDKARELGPAGVRALVRVGVEKATRYGFWVRRDVIGFVELVFGLGPEFDQLDATSWAREILEDVNLGLARLDRVYRELAARVAPTGPGAWPGTRIGESR